MFLFFLTFESYADQNELSLKAHLLVVQGVSLFRRLGPNELRNDVTTTLARQRLRAGRPTRYSRV